MSADYQVLEAEQEYEDKVMAQVLQDAAIRIVVEKLDRVSALQQSKESMALASEALNDATGAIGTLAEAQRPTTPVGKEKQVAAIARSLEHFLPFSR